jgi:cytochrome c peroxidase
MYTTTITRSMTTLGLQYVLVLFGSVLAAQDTEPLPLLPDSPFDYVKYAVTDLPEHYLPSGPFGDAGNANNTPDDNPITNDGATLGRVLFYDPRLSVNHSISCASCHTQETGFGDARRLSAGHAGQLTFRHSMSLTNAMFYFSGRFR